MLGELSTEKKWLIGDGGRGVEVWWGWGGAVAGGGWGGGVVADCNFEHDDNALSVALMNKFNGTPTGCRGLCKCHYVALVQTKLLL